LGMGKDSSGARTAIRTKKGKVPENPVGTQSVPFILNEDTKV